LQREQSWLPLLRSEQRYTVFACLVVSPGDSCFVLLGFLLAALFWVCEWGTQCSDFAGPMDPSLDAQAVVCTSLNSVGFEPVLLLQLRSFLGDALLSLVLLGCTAVGSRKWELDLHPTGNAMRLD
jgi:hypothetical protein